MGKQIVLFTPREDTFMKPSRRQAVKVLIISQLTNHSALVIAGDSQSNRGRSDGAFTIKGPLPLLQFGVEIDSYLDAQRSVGLHANYDNMLFYGWDRTGIHYKRFWGNSFFVQLHADHIRENAESRGLGLGFVVGHAWQLDMGMTLAVDWLGVTAYRQKPDKYTPAYGYSPTLPVFGWGWAF